MELGIGDYTLVFADGGVTVVKGGETLYFNRRPIYVSVKDAGAMSIFGDCAYESVRQDGEHVVATGRYTSANGSVFAVRDVYALVEGGLKIAREATVEQAAADDLGFQTKISLYAAQSEEVPDFYYFSPAEWYKHNEYASDRAQGKDMSAEYYWRKETYMGLPMFAMQHIASGETVCFSRWAADVTLPSLDRVASENYAYLDEKATVGSLGISKAKPEALTYTYYSHPIRTPLPGVVCDGLSIDYIYPGVNGQVPGRGVGAYVTNNMTFRSVQHPVRAGWTHRYAIAVTFGQYESFQEMMRATWRQVYPRLKDRLAEPVNERLFHNNMKLLAQVTRRFGDAWGTPFVAQLPDFDPNSYSAEIGFVGQQAGIGYQLLRWGTLEQVPEAVEKGLGILNFWVHTTMTAMGCPKVWYHLSAHQFEPQPIWTRQIGDGLENILDAYVFLHKRGEEHADWREYCVKTADWLVANQNADGSYYRAYNDDGSVCMDSKANTPSVVRFLIQMYLVTGTEGYKRAALRAGAWSYDNLYVNMEYRGGTCDNLDIMDKEAGIYALFAFLSLYDLTQEARWLEAACGAADYVETFTYVWNYPIVTPYPCMPFNKNHISGQSPVTVGTGGGDIYMASCSYVYYRLYLLTGDDHYRDFAEFINLNTKQANDVDGSFGYKYPGLVHEGGFFSEQQYQGRYHWLPWCTYVEVDPASRLYDTFGAYEIADCEKLPLEERQARNAIYDHYA